MKHGRREELSVTVDPRLYDVIERHAARVAALAREGYQRTAREDLDDAEAYLAALDEIGEE